MKRIIKYVSGTCDFGFFYSKESNASLVGCSDADWVGNADDRKSTTGGCFYVGTNLVAWMRNFFFFCLFVNCRSRIYRSWKLLFTTSLDEEAFK